jgi:branched-chain amino acid transport system substrate-binding protein
MKANKWILMIAFVALAAMAITTCAAPATQAPAPTSAPAPTTAPQPAAFTCTDKIGCVTVAPGDPVHIAYMLVVAGDSAQLGIDSRRGAEIAVDDHNGTVAGHPVKFDGQDAGCGPEGGQAAAAKLAADNTIVAVIGSSCSSEWTAGGPTISKAGFLTISPSATSPVLTDPANLSQWPTFFRTAHNDKVQGAVAAQFVYTQLKITSAAAIHDGGPYTQGLANAFADNFKKLGGTITSIEAVDPNTKDTKPVLTKIAADKPGLIFYPDFVPLTPLITITAKTVPGLENAKLMTADGSFSPDFLKASGQAAVGVYHTSPDFSSFGTDYAQKFLPAYQKKYNEKPINVFHAHAYDAMNIVLTAIDAVAVKDADGTVHIGRQALVDWVAQLKSFKGLTGNLTCDPNHDCADPHIAAYQDTADNVSSDTIPTAPIWKP